MVRGHEAFTLVEIVMATSIMGIIAAATFLLLSSGLAGYDTGSRNLNASAHVCDFHLALRSEVARCDDVTFAAGDSLHLRLPGGTDVAFASRPVANGREVFRWSNQSGTWRENPLMALATLLDLPDSPSSLRFSLGPSSEVVTEVTTAAIDFRTVVHRWSAP